MRTADLNQLLGECFIVDVKNRYTVRATFAIFEYGDDFDGPRLVSSVDVYTHGGEIEVENGEVTLTPALERLIAKGADDVRHVSKWLKPFHDDAEAAFRQLSEQDSAPVPDAVA